MYLMWALSPPLWLALMCVRQTREQLQAELTACQARITDLERSLAEKGQVTQKKGGDRGVLAPLLLVMLLVCLVAGGLCWRYADRVCRSFTMWCHLLNWPIQWGRGCVLFMLRPLTSGAVFQVSLMWNILSRFISLYLLRTPFHPLCINTELLICPHGKIVISSTFATPYIFTYILLKMVEHKHTDTVRW